MWGGANQYWAPGGAQSWQDPNWDHEDLKTYELENYAKLIYESNRDLVREQRRQNSVDGTLNQVLVAIFWIVWQIVHFVLLFDLILIQDSIGKPCEICLS